MAFTRCILFTRYTREQNTTCKGHLAFQKATISLENDVHIFFPLPLTFITINVRQVLDDSRDLTCYFQNS